MTLDELFAATKLDDPRASNALVDALYPRLRSFFRRHPYPGLDVDDLVQATLVVLFSERDRFVADHPRAYQYRVYDVARSILKTKRLSLIREGRRRVYTPPVAIAPDTSPSEQAVRSEELGHVTEAIDDGGSNTRRTIKDWLASVSWVDQAQREGVARSTLRVRVWRALARVRDRLKQANAELFSKGSAPTTT